MPSRAVAEDQQFQKLFEGYELVLMDDLPREKPIEELETAALRGTYPTEPRLIPGRVYVFRKTTQISNEVMAIRVFPQRLAAIGARVTKAPQSSRDLMYLVVGGPLFRIEFEKDGHQGVVLNRVPANIAQDIREELIVSFK